MKIFILIPVYNHIHLTLACLESLQKQAYRPFEILVIDGGSTDNTTSILKERYPEITVLEELGHLWWTEAMERGVEHILSLTRASLALSPEGGEGGVRGSDDFILSFNQDLVVEDPDYLSKLVETSLQHKRALVGSSSQYRDGESESGGGRFDWPHAKKIQHPEILEKAGGKRGSVLEELDFLVGRGVLIPIEVFKKAGNYRSNLFPQVYGDVDFSYRAKKAGFNLVLALHTNLLHLERPSMLYEEGRFMSYKKAWQILTSHASYLNLKDGFSFIDRHCPKPYRLKNKIAFFSKSLGRSFTKTFPLQQIRCLNPVSKVLPVFSRRSQNSTMNFKVSIITSVHSGDRYIRPFLEDITRQTIFNQCELILTNANSPGHEEDVIKEYLSKHPNIVYRRLNWDPGLYPVWNEAIRRARGEYITNANLDDRKAPEALARHAEVLDQNPDIDVVCAALLVTRQENETWENHTAHNKWWVDVPEAITTKDLFQEETKKGIKTGKILPHNMPHCMPMWRKSVHKKYGYFDEATYGPVADWAFWLKCSAAGVKFRKISEPLGLYYVNPASHNRGKGSLDQQNKKAKIIQGLIHKYYRNS